MIIGHHAERIEKGILRIFLANYPADSTINKKG
jgi:hypothetical protein